MVMRARITIILLIVMTVVLTGCAGSSDAHYTQITQEEAQEMMQLEDMHIIIDVRTQEEFNSGHIPGAICIPNETIGTDPPEELPDKDQVLLIYCRSGNRSKDASQKLANMGYTNVYEFGGINTWTGEIVKEETQSDSETISADKLLIDINGQTLTATLEDNSSAEALAELVGSDGLTMEMEDYSNFEKVGDLPQSLPTNDEQIDTDAGDLILYQGNRFVIYYDKNSWDFTRLGHVEGISKSELQELLGDGDVTVTLRLP